MYVALMVALGSMVLYVALMVALKTMVLYVALMVELKTMVLYVSLMTVVRRRVYNSIYYHVKSTHSQHLLTTNECRSRRRDNRGSP